MNDFALPETRYALSGDVNVAYQVMGDGPVDIILVPGFISHIEFRHELPGYTAFLRRLSSFARVVTFDKRGQGLSDRVSDAPSLEQRMDDVRAIMDAIGSQRATLFGHSEGCAMSALVRRDISGTRFQAHSVWGLCDTARREYRGNGRAAHEVLGHRCNAETCRPKPGSGPGRRCPVRQVRTAFGQSGSCQILYDVEFADRSSVLSFRQYAFRHSCSIIKATCRFRLNTAVNWQHAFPMPN